MSKRKRKIKTGEIISIYLPKTLDKKTIEWLNTVESPSKEIIEIVNLHITEEFVSLKNAQKLFAKVGQLNPVAVEQKEPKIEEKAIKKEANKEAIKVEETKKDGNPTPKSEGLNLNKGYFGKFQDTDLASLSKKGNSKSFLGNNLKK